MQYNKTYKIIIPYTESASPAKKFKIEYVVKADNRSNALKKAEKEFESYSENNSASWIRIPDQSGIRIWRVFPDDPTTPQFIDKLIEKLPDKNPEKTISILKQLGKLEDSTASSKVISQMKSDTPQIVVEAINTLGNIGDPTSFFAVKNAYFQNDNLDIKKAVINNLLKLALPEDNIISFYKVAIEDPKTRDLVFKLDCSDLIPLWLAQISNKKEYDLVKKNVLKQGEKALKVIVMIESNHPQVLSYASKLLKELEPMAIEYQWEDWILATKKYDLL